ncbi:MAG: hypothetical protein QXI39_05520 [Candidatus Bathyarchaeia archaeon]
MRLQETGAIRHTWAYKGWCHELKLKRMRKKVLHQDRLLRIRSR